MADMEWRCDDCGGRSFARVDERKPDGHFGPGPQVRCVNCKSVSDYPASPALPAVDGGEDWEARDARRLDHIKKLERRIHNQRRSNRDNWEIVESRNRWLGSKASRDAYSRLLKTYRRNSAELEAANTRADWARVNLEAAESRVQSLEEEVKRLKKVVSECAAALPNGAYIHPELASIEFMEKLPGGIASVCAALKENGNG